MAENFINMVKITIHLQIPEAQDFKYNKFKKHHT